MDEHDLQKHVRQQLEGKQYLFFLDNVKENMDWLRLKGAFPNNREKRCRVVITTRSAKVNKRKCDCVYRMEFLSLESSKELLRWRVFGENKCPVELEEHEKNLITKCDGLPLALLSVATMLKKHRDKVEWWNEVAYSFRYYCDRDPREALMLNHLPYSHLPNHLLPCLLYLTVFPKSFAISVWKLLRLWIAEGFIILEKGCALELEDIAEQYLEQLVDRNFVMVSKRRSNGRIGICQVTDLVYYFCEKKAAPGNLFVDRNYLTRSNQNIDVILGESRRIGLNVNALNFLSGNLPTKKPIHSFLTFSRTETEVDQQGFTCITKSIKYLKVLHTMKSLFFTCLPDQLWSLVLLKYLAIYGSIDSLPSTLINLWSFQTLIVKTTSPTLEIQADIWETPHFRHLHTNASATFPRQIITSRSQKTEADDNNVRTLCYISPECCKREVFHRATKLRKLGRRGTLVELFESSLLEHLNKLEYLENLKLLNCDNTPGLPPKITFPKKLRKLTLSNTRLDWKYMRTLGEMENLEVLKLNEYAFIGELWKTENGGFLRVKHLHIGRTDLMVWEASPDNFPQLRSLEISGCNQLRRIPHNLADIQSLQSVRLHSITSPGVGYSLKRICLVKFL